MSEIWRLEPAEIIHPPYIGTAGYLAFQLNTNETVSGHGYMNHVMTPLYNSPYSMTRRRENAYE